MKSKGQVTIVEMGLRDGLQNEKKVLSTLVRVEFAEKLIAAGLKKLELGSFVSPRWVPQMAGTTDVFTQIQKKVMARQISHQVELSALVPNEQGMRDAIQSGVKEIALFTAASDSFTRKNINCSIEESFERFKPVLALARQHKIKVRGYLSTCFGCPFEGKVSEAKVVRLAKRLHDLGCYEVSIGDTIGVAHVGQVQSLFGKLKKLIPAQKLAGHFHDTRGQALVNILAAYELGIRIFDTSLGGLGGCPYAPGATGNVATEDVVYMFHGMGLKTGLNLAKLIEINQWMEREIEHALPSKVGRVGVLKPLGVVRPV